METNENYLKWFDKHGKDRPRHHPHGTEDDIRRLSTKLLPNKWRQEGNLLIGEVADGTRVVQTIPTDYLLTGTDKEGLPTFKKL